MSKREIRNEGEVWQTPFLTWRWKTKCGLMGTRATREGAIRSLEKYSKRDKQ